ncbi:MAG: hypothetical protein KF696_10710 [Planctomycetes bacterium]|nr:hypothetical protein [Planctomycetota bacterium]MCW8135099.1 hypothetical protein [Planctomycetota bacterium]
MSVRISREPGHFAVLLNQPSWLDPGLYGPDLARALGLPRSDTVRMCRLQRGILFEGGTEVQAAAAVKLLSDHGIAASAVPDDALPLLPKPVHVSLANIDPEGLGTPSLAGGGLPREWQWENLALMCAGILVGADAQTAALMEKVEEDTLADAQDRRSLAERTLEKARSRVFPMKAELARPGGDVADALASALTRRKPAETTVEGFGAISVVLDMLFTRPLERLRINGDSRVTNLPRSGSRAVDLHRAVNELARLATSATIPGAALALADGADSGDYVFEDLVQFDDHCRWAYYGRLQRK